MAVELLASADNSLLKAMMSTSWARAIAIARALSTLTTGREMGDCGVESV